MLENKEEGKLLSLVQIRRMGVAASTVARWTQSKRLLPVPEKTPLGGKLYKEKDVKELMKKCKTMNGVEQIYTSAPEIQSIQEELKKLSNEISELKHALYCLKRN